MTHCHSVGGQLLGVNFGRGLLAHSVGPCRLRPRTLTPIKHSQKEKEVRETLAGVAKEVPMREAALAMIYVQWTSGDAETTYAL